MPTNEKEMAMKGKEMPQVPYMLCIRVPSMSLLRVIILLEQRLRLTRVLYGN
jgi:hypothetical protein